MRTLSLKAWFNKYARIPVLFIVLITVIFQIVYIFNARNAQVNKRNRDVERLVAIANRGILSNDRSIIETTLDVITHDMGAKKIFFCADNKLETSFPSIATFDCSNPRKAKFGEELLVVSPKGTSEFIFYFYFPAFNGISPVLLMLIIFILFSFVMVSMLQFIQRRIRKDLIAPIESIATEGAVVNKANILELDNIASKSKQIKELREAEALAKQAQFMAHDIRRPFSQIKLVLSMFDSFSSDPQKIEAAKKEIEKSIKKVEVMLSDVIETNKSMAMNISSCAIAKLVDQAISEIKLGLVDIHKNLDSSLLILGDEQKMTRCLTNIIENAVDAISSSRNLNKKGQIDILTREVNKDGKKYVELVISNNGPCIAENDLPKIFQSFFTRGKSHGTGLGLAFVQKVVSMHEGFITAQNRLNKDGVEFSILLPLSQKLSDQKSVFSKDKKYTLLLLDDDELYRTLVKEMIKKDITLSNINIIETASVKDATKITEREMINYALVDFDLGKDGTGLDYLDYLNRKRSGVVCALHTNKYLDADVRNKLNEYGVAYIPKPLETASISAFFRQ